MTVSKQPPQAWDGIKWQYKHLLIQQPFSGYLNELGEEGWEVVAAYPAPDAKKDALFCLLKRPKPHGDE